MKFREYFLAAVVIIVACTSLYFVLPAYTKYQETRITVHRLQERLAEQEEAMKKLREELAGLKTDYRAIERVAREKFGLCKEGEKVYHFDNDVIREEKPAE